MHLGLATREIWYITILISTTFIGKALITGEALIKGGAYFNVDTQRCGTYWRAVLIWGPALITGNTVIILFHFAILFILWFQKIIRAFRNRPYYWITFAYISFYISSLARRPRDTWQIKQYWVLGQDFLKQYKWGWHCIKHVIPTKHCSFLHSSKFQHFQKSLSIQENHYQSEE